MINSKFAIHQNRKKLSVFPWCSWASIINVITRCNRPTLLLIISAYRILPNIRRLCRISETTELILTKFSALHELHSNQTRITIFFMAPRPARLFGKIRYITIFCQFTAEEIKLWTEWIVQSIQFVVTSVSSLEEKLAPHWFLMESKVFVEWKYYISSVLFVYFSLILIISLATGQLEQEA